VSRTSQRGRASTREEMPRSKKKRTTKNPELASFRLEEALATHFRPFRYSVPSRETEPWQSADLLGSGRTASAFTATVTGSALSLSHQHLSEVGKGWGWGWRFTASGSTEWRGGDLYPSPPLTAVSWCAESCSGSVPRVRLSQQVSPTCLVRTVF
jgi:hypothetical protein